MLQRVNESLERENATLRKEVTFLNQFANSKRSSVAVPKQGSGEDVKDKILGRLNKKRDTFLTLDNESTGIFTSKLNSSKSYEENII